MVVIDATGECHVPGVDVLIEGGRSFVVADGTESNVIRRASVCGQPSHEPLSRVQTALTLEVNGEGSTERDIQTTRLELYDP